MSEPETNNDRKYFTIIPNIVDDLNLSVYAIRLYLHIKRVAGNSGECFQSTRTLSEKCNIAAGTVTSAKRELLDKGLISITPRDTGRGKSLHVIKVIDVWGRNMDRYS